uniref:DDE Tnp4 domain-containing protein n=1 Tax=Lactuca sativa TaxID=4236 RepID=A0A9R1XGY2_LACSA|nr:hypothetical protein LSAT_V11C400219020 [Lactuca sativa]
MDTPILNPAHALRARQLQIVNLICLLLTFITQRNMANKKRVRLPTRKVILQIQAVWEELLHNLLEGGQCRDLIHMSENTFRRLCEILQTVGGLRRTQRMSVEEHVASFLHIVSNLRTRFISWMYPRSRSTRSRCFHRVLRSIIAIESLYIQQPTGDVVPREIQESRRFYPFFKDCIGAIDGTHVRVHVPNRDAPRYRGRKGYPTINVLVACTFDLKFTYVLTGWEGTASDSRIIKNAFTRNDKLLIPSGKYCLVDGGLPHTNKLMAPYRGVRYHLKEYSMRGPQNSKELFNLRHASLRNTIERAFGVLKRRFPIIRNRGINLEDEVMQEILNGPQEQDRCNSTETDEVIMIKQEAGGSEKEQVKWSEIMDYAYIQAMIKQQETDNRVNGSFTPTAYAQMVEELNIKHQMDTKSHLKNHYKTLKKHFSQWYDLFRGISMSGFSWNSSSQLIKEEEEVWDNLIKAASLRTKKIAYFDEMLVLFARDRASGAHAETAKERNARLNKNENIQVETIKEVDDMLANNEIHLENEYVDLDDNIQDVIPPPFSQEQSSCAKKCKSKKRKFEDDEEEEDINSKIMKSVDNVAGAIREGEEIYRELELVGLEPHELPRALNFLATNQAKAPDILQLSPPSDTDGCPQRYDGCTLDDEMLNLASIS